MSGMAGMGFVVPLYIIVSIEAVIGAWLMMPMPLAWPAVKLCRFSKHNTVARTVVNTAAAFLSILLVSPLYDTYVMHKAKEMATHTDPESIAQTSTGEATSQLSACLTAAAISNMFLLRHLGACIDEREALRHQLQDAGMEPNEEGTVNKPTAAQKRKGRPDERPDIPLTADDQPLKAE